MNKIRIAEILREYIITQLNNFNSPSISFLKPIIVRVLNNNYKKIYSYLDLLADDNGNIDAIGIITDISSSLISAKPFTVNIPIIGDILIGEGKISMSLPFVNKDIIFTKKDLDVLYELINTDKS